EPWAPEVRRVEVLRAVLDGVDLLYIAARHATQELEHPVGAVVRIVDPMPVAAVIRYPLRPRVDRDNPRAPRILDHRLQGATEMRADLEVGELPSSCNGILKC